MVTPPLRAGRLVRLAGFFVAGDLVAGGLVACNPSLTDTTSIVSEPRLLAVQATPAEAATGKGFALSALYVGPNGPADPSAINWAICLLQNALGDPDPIAPSCFVAASPSLTPLGTGGTVSGTIPSDACELFGPESPPAVAGQPSPRPTDPDSTGGFYLPVRVNSGAGDWSAALERIACQPSGVTLQVFTAFSNGYVANQNPTVSSLALVNADGSETTIAPDGPDGGAGLTLPSGAQASLRAGWPSCPSSPAACGGAETYLSIDPTSKQIDTGRESIVASWYASGGTFALDRVGRDGTDPATTVDDTWTAPSGGGQAHLWVVLRDARGGVGWGSYTIELK